jgi:Glycosyl transferase family 2
MATRNPIAALRAVSHRLAAILGQQMELQASVNDLSVRVETLAAEVRALGRVDSPGSQMEVLRAIYDDEAANRQRLWALRESPEYARAFEEANPLVTVCIPTYTNAEQLAARSLPSVLAQTHENLEVIVVGDDAPLEMEEVVRSFGDPRLQFVNLTIRGPYPADPVELWHVAGAAATNEALRLASGVWITHNSDDDTLTPDHVEVLLAAARRSRLELVYGKIRQHNPGADDSLLGVFPPTAPGHFGMQAALVHSGLRMFTHELVVFGEPGDWVWIRRMVRLGVRMGMIDDVVVDYYPSNIWGTPARPPGVLD